MKRLLRSLITMAFLLSPMCVASSPVYTIMLSKVFLSVSPDEISETPKRQRTPCMPVECVITSEGVQISGAQ